MNKGTYVAVSGSMAQERAMEMIAHNMANVSTTGFKKDRLVFEAHLQKSMDPKADLPTPEEIEEGNFSKRVHDSTYLVNSNSYTDFEQGPLKMTDSSLDIALQGDGFFAVQTPDGERYTRGGGFHMNLQGQLAIGDGLPVLNLRNEPIYLNEENIKIANDGTMTSADNLPLARLKVVHFADKSLLKKEGAGLYSSESPDEAVPSNALVKQGYLEGSNINPVSEMTRMITVLRTYETLQKAVHSHDDMTARLIADVAR